LDEFGRRFGEEFLILDMALGVRNYVSPRARALPSGLAEGLESERSCFEGGVCCGEDGLSDSESLMSWNANKSFVVEILV
jgi:hypothetical protein